MGQAVRHAQLQRRRRGEGEELVRLGGDRASSRGAATQPTFQPVSENIFPAEPMRRQRARMPGRVASGICGRPSNTRCS